MVSESFKSETFKRHSAEVALELLEIIDSNLAEPIRLVNNTENITSGGNLYKARWFEVPRAPDLGGDPGETNAMIDNVDLVISALLDQIPDVKESYSVLRWSLILASNPDQVEKTEEYEIKDYELDATNLSLSIVRDNFFTEQYPAHKATPASHPGAFTTDL